jgi:uncharacterized membrane protein YfcA
VAETLPAAARPAPPEGSRLTIVTCGGVGGLLSGLLGIGGGTAMVPLMVLLGRIGQRQAHAISLGAMIPIAVVAIAVYAFDGKVDVLAAAALTAGSVLGARRGADFLARIPERRLKAVFGAFLIVAALSLLLDP